MSTIQTQEQRIIQALQELNPFEGRTIVKSHHIWDESFTDVPSINSHVSDQIFDAIERCEKNNISIGITLVAPKGTGKTHILSRIRHRLKANDKSCFIYLCEYGNLTSVRTQLLQGIATSLRKPGSSGTMQWQELATALINKVAKKEYKPQNLVAQFPKLLIQNSQVVTTCTSKISQAYETDTNIVRAIVWTLSKDHAPFAINWLAGRELSEVQSKLLGLPEIDVENRDTQSFNTAQQILDLIASYTVPVICLDELDGTELVSEEEEAMGGFTRAMVVASLGKDICNSLKRGVVLAATYDKTWREEIRSVNATNSVEDRLAEKKLELNPLKPDDAVNLVTSWLKLFYEQNQLLPPQPLYPFEEKQIREYGDRATVREILQWCAKNIPTGQPVDPVKRLEKVYREVESTLEDFSEDNDLIAKSLIYGLGRLCEKTISGVTLKRIETEVKPSWKHKGFIQFKIIGEENKKPVRIGVAVAQHAHGKTVGATIKYLTDYKAFDLTRGCLIRRKAIPQHWQVANQGLANLCNKKGGEWISFKDEEVRSLVVLYKMLRNLDQEMFSSEDFEKFVNEKHPIDQHPLLCDILSDPSGQAPVDVIDEDLGLEDLPTQGAETDNQESGELELQLAT